MQVQILSSRCLAPSSSGQDTALSRLVHGFEPRWSYTAASSNGLGTLTFNQCNASSNLVAAIFKMFLPL